MPTTDILQHLAVLACVKNTPLTFTSEQVLPTLNVFGSQLLTKYFWIQHTKFCLSSRS